MDIKQLRAAYKAAHETAQAALTEEEFDAEKAQTLVDEAKGLKGRLDALENLGDAPQTGSSGIKVTADEVDRKASDPELPAYKTLGEQLLDLAKWQRGGGLSPRLVKAHKSAAKAISGMSEAVPADGGLLVQTDLAAGIMEPMYRTGVILSRVQRLTISGNANSYEFNAVSETSRAAGSRWGGVLAYRVAEGDAVTASAPKFDKRRIDIHRVSCLAYATDDVLEDAALLETEIGNACRNELQFFMEDDIINGTGSGMPTGLLAANALVSQAKETGQDADTVNAKNISRMWSRRWPGGDYVWLINQELEPQLDEMAYSVGTGGQLVYMPAGGLADAPYGRLKGRPVISTEYNAILGDLGDILLVDLSQYKFATKGGIQGASSMHVSFTSHQMTYRFTVRYGGRPAWASDLTPYKATSGNTLSPFVGLAARA